MAKHYILPVMTDIRSISELLRDLHDNITSNAVRFDYLLKQVHERGFGIILFILATPMALPLPVPPGVNIVLATPLILLTAQQAMGRHTIWLPQRIKNKTIKKTTIDRILDKTLPWIVRLEYFIRPRLGFATQGLFSHLIGVFGLIMALSICVPLPMTNTVPSLGIALMAIGVVMRDGLAVIIGALIGVIWVALLAAIIIFLGTEGLEIVKEMIKDVI